MTELFYVFGIGLTVLALVVAFGGMRMENFPSPAIMRAGLALMGVFVVGACAFAIVLSREEQEVRAEEISEFREEEAAEMEAEAGAGAEEGSEPTEPAEPTDAEPEEAEGIALASPEEGDLLFVLPDSETENPTLEAEAGEVTIDYVNPSPVPHNVAIEDGSETVAQGETVTGGAAGPATADLEPGEYAYYCSIPSHREAGMEGTLTVK